MTRKKVLWLSAPFFVVIVLYSIYLWYIHNRNAVDGIFNILSRQGYIANIGFSGIYQPGNIIQTVETGQDGKETKLRTPIIFLWGSECFPGKKPKTSPFVLPDSSGISSASLNIGAELLGKLLPAVRLDSAVVADYSLKLENVHVRTFARADLSHQFSEKCVHALKEALDDGDKIEWFSVINEVVEVDSLRFELKWRSKTSVDARISAKNKVEDALAAAVKESKRMGAALKGDIKSVVDNDRTTVIEAQAPVVIAYRARPLQPVYEDGP